MRHGQSNQRLFTGGQGAFGKDRAVVREKLIGQYFLILTNVAKFFEVLWIVTGFYV